MGRCLKNAYGLFYGALPQTPPKGYYPFGIPFVSFLSISE